MINILSIIKVFCLGVFLLTEGIRDLKKREISMVSVIITSAIGFLIQIPNIQKVWLSLIGGVIVGVIFLLISKLTKERIGYGDGLVLLTAGICLGFRGVFCLLCASLLVASVISIALLLLKKVGRKTELPFVTFMIPGYLLLFIMS